MVSKLARVLFVCISLAGSLVANAQSKITGLTIDPQGKGFAITVKGEELNAPRVMRVNNDRSYILEWDASLVGASKWIKVQKNGLDTAQLLWFSARPPKVRLHLRIRATDQPILSQVADGWRVSLNLAKPRESEPSMDQAIAMIKADGQVTAPKKPQQVVEMKTVEVYDQKVQPRTVSLAAAAAKPGDPIVSLEFTNTDIVQVLKALAMQANVNIVPSAEIKGTITLTLEKVTLTQALDFVTAMTGLRYGKVGKTIIVATAARFPEIMRQLGAANQLGPETRVIPIYSGEGAQIKAVVLKSVNQDGGDGGFEILLPSEELKVQSVEAIMNNTPPPTAEGDKPDPKAQAAGGTLIQSSSGKSGDKKQNDPYVVLIGTKDKLDEVEKTVRRLDEQICQLLGVLVPSSSALVQRSYLVQGGNAKGLLDAIAGKDGNKVGNVEVVATPEGSNSRLVIVLKGRENEVDRVMDTLRELDNTVSEDTKYEVYEVKFSDPRALREDLIVHVPGLTASIPPASAGNPRLFVPNQTANAANQKTDDKGKTSGTNGESGGSGESGKGGAPSAESQVATNIQQPFASLEPFAVPMRLILRGTEQQISRAHEYLAYVDIAPKQVAIELRVVELSKEDALKTGIDWNILGGGAVKILRLNNSNSEPKNTIGMSLSGKNWSGDVGATIDRSVDQNRIIARPNLLALDGRESELFIGDVIRYVESIVSGQNGPTITTGEVSVGVRLAVLARVGADGNLIMDLRPRVSFLRGFLDLPNNAGRLPQTSERIAQSTISMKSGETIAIGGLIQDQDVKSMSGIPFLMDLPIVGRLFRKDTTTKRRTEVVIFLTARSLDGPATAGNDQSTVTVPSKDVDPKKPTKKGP